METLICAFTNDGETFKGFLPAHSIQEGSYTPFMVEADTNASGNCHLGMELLLETDYVANGFDSSVFDLRPKSVETLMVWQLKSLLGLRQFRTANWSPRPNDNGTAVDVNGPLLVGNG